MEALETRAFPVGKGAGIQGSKQEQEPDVIREDFHQRVERLRGQVRELKQHLERSKYEALFRENGGKLERESRGGRD